MSVILSQQQIGKFFVIEIDALFEGSFLTTLVISSINNGLKEKFYHCNVRLVFYICKD